MGKTEEKEIENVIIHEVPGNEVYAGMGRKCKWCECFFMSRYDYQLHIAAFGAKPHGSGLKHLDSLDWKQSRFDDGEWCPADKHPDLVSHCKINGKVVMGGYEYMLSANGKWLKRRRIM